MLDRIRQIFSREGREEIVREELEKVRSKMPAPVLWLLGRTQSGKTSLVRYLTGAERAEIGNGYKPCTRFSQRYDFPTDEAPLVAFLDTRGLDEAGYDPAEDLAKLNNEAHAILVTVKLLDHAQENVFNALRALRRANPSRPVILVVTCLHEAYPQQQHRQPYPFDSSGEPLTVNPPLPDTLTRSLAEQRRRFDGLVDHVVPVDLTTADDGFDDPEYGGERLRETLLAALPAAYGQVLAQLDRAVRSQGDEIARRAQPHILAYSSMAATAGALPIPFLDLLLLGGIQSRMVFHLGELYGQPLGAKRFLEVAGTLGIGILTRQAARELAKVIPVLGTILGSAVGAAMAGATTYALGQAFCFYYRSVKNGREPTTDELRSYYQKELEAAQQAWLKRFGAADPESANPEAGS